MQKPPRVKAIPNERPKIPPIKDSRRELTALESFLYETLASDDPGLDPKIMQAAVKRVLRDITPEVLQQMELEYAQAMAYELKRQDLLIKLAELRNENITKT